MRYKVIINGCASTARAQAEELNGFISDRLIAEKGRGETILFYSDRAGRDDLTGLMPTESVKRVRVNHYQPELVLEALQQVEKDSEADLYLFPGGFAGSELAVRFAYRMNGSSLVRVQQVEWAETRLIAKKAVYSSHVLGTFSLAKKPYCISPEKGSADSLPIPLKKLVRVTDYDMTHLQSDHFVKDREWIPGEAEKGLEQSKFLVIGGRGMASRKNGEHLKNIADQVGAGFGVTRPVAMSGWVDLDRMIGISGAVTRPEVCILAGVSGAAAFYAGIEKSKLIVAINSDERAPITRKSDVIIIDDWKAVLDELAVIIEDEAEKS